MIYIYRAIESGMVSYTEVREGAVSLSDLVGINTYLQMRSDIEYNEMKTAERK